LKFSIIFIAVNLVRAKIQRPRNVCVSYHSFYGPPCILCHSNRSSSHNKAAAFNSRLVDKMDYKPHRFVRTNRSIEIRLHVLQASAQNEIKIDG